MKKIIDIILSLLSLVFTVVNIMFIPSVIILLISCIAGGIKA